MTSDPDGRRTVEAINPFTLEPVASYTLATFDEVHGRVKACHEVFLRWRRVPVAERASMLEVALGYFEDHREDIAQDITSQMGRPLAHARREIDGLLERARYLAGVAATTLAAEPLPAKASFDRAITHEPLGVVFIISAWNYPLLIAINGVMAALLGGNAVLLKHSTQTSSIGAHFAEAFGRLPGYDGLLQAAVIDHATTGRVIEEAGVRHVVFTGSVEGGRTIYGHAARAPVIP